MVFPVNIVWSYDSPALPLYNIVFLKFKNKKPLKAIEEGLKSNLLIKKVYKINNKGNKI